MAVGRTMDLQLNDLVAFQYKCMFLGRKLVLIHEPIGHDVEQSRKIRGFIFNAVDSPLRSSLSVADVSRIIDHTPPVLQYQSPGGN